MAYVVVCLVVINHTTADHKEGEQLEDRRNVGKSSCNSGEGTDQRVQSLMFMMTMLCNTRGGVRSTRGLGPMMTARGQSIGISIGMLPQTLIMSRLDQLSRLGARN